MPDQPFYLIHLAVDASQEVGTYTLAPGETLRPLAVGMTANVTGPPVANAIPHVVFLSQDGTPIAASYWNREGTIDQTQDFYFSLGAQNKQEIIDVNPDGQYQFGWLPSIVLTSGCQIVAAFYEEDTSPATPFVPTASLFLTNPRVWVENVGLLGGAVGDAIPLYTAQPLLDQVA